MDITLFNQEVKKLPPRFCLIVAKDPKEALDIYLTHWKGDVKRFEGESFASSDFYLEAENFSLFQEKRLFFIERSDKLSEEDKQRLKNYLKNPPSQMNLLLSSATSFLKKEIMELKGVVLELSEEKPWQKKKRLEELTKTFLKERGFSISQEVAADIVDSLPLKKDLLIQELEKLMAYTWEKKFINREDVKKLIVKEKENTLWEVGEAFFAHDYLLCWKKVDKMLEDESLFTIFGSLRGQIKTLLEMRALFERGGSTLVVQAFPYLKGMILNKKVEEIKKNRVHHLKKALFFLFEAELKAKTLTCEPLLLFEMFLMKVSP